MGIFGRLGTLLKANINDVISKAEDPEKILNQLILDMKDQLIEAKKQVAVAIADEKRLKKQLDNELHMAREWEKKAMMAVRAGRDDLAKEALRRKGEHDQLASEFQGQWEAQKAAADKLRESLRQLNNKIEEAKRKKNLLIARKKRAEAQQKIQATMSGLTDESAFDAFDRMSEKIEQMEAEAEASSELADDFAGNSLDNQFANLEAESGADSELEALKAKMGMLDNKSSQQFSFEEQKQTKQQTVSAGGRGTWDSDDF
ncbi:MAG: PspA/IM30 family protein [Myxococcota bacterium]|jgi:phage shock protein A|nr:PspA/IM30 family protein [Myxococcota bacterium]MEC9441722.1 PspA/IM30 family protein [Myxococcota bacterium]